MLILALDTASSGTSVCLWLDGAVLSAASEKMDRGQDARLIPMVLDVMRDGCAAFSDLDAIVATKGPGSFTGVRVGLAAAQGLGIAANKPVLGINRFDIMTQGCTGDILTVLDSKRLELYVRLDRDGRIGDHLMWTPDQVRAVRGVRVRGDCAGLLGPAWAEDVLIDKDPVDEARIAAHMAAQAIKACAGGADFGAYAPLPLYIRPPDVTIPKKTDAP